MTAIPAPGTVVAEFSLPSELGNERLALPRVAEAVTGSGLTDEQLEALKTAVAEAVMNAIEHGNGGRPEVPVDVRVLRLTDGVAVTVTDLGGGGTGRPRPEEPDLDLKLEGRQGPRGWGLFLIEHMVDQLEISTDGEHHSVRLTIHTRPPTVDDKGGHDDGHL